MNDVKYWKDKLNKISQTSTKLTEAVFDDDAIKRYYSDRGPTAAEKEAQANKFLASRQNVSTSLPSTNQNASIPLPPTNVKQDKSSIILPNYMTDKSIKSPPKQRSDTEISRMQQLVDPDARLKGANVWRDARNPQYAGRGQTQPAAVPVLQPAAAPQPAAGSIQPQSFTRMGDVQKQLDVSAGRGLNTSAQIDPLSMPREPETGYGRPAPATQGSNIKNMLSRLSRLGRSAGDEYSNLYVSPMRSGVASRGTTPVQDRAYIKDLQNKLAKNPLDDNLRGELARMQRFYPDEIKEASTTSDIGQFNPGADRLSSSRMPSKLGKFNPGADSLTGARMPTNVGKFSPGEDRTTNPRMPSDIRQVRPGADRSAIVPSSEPTASSTPRANLRSAMPGRGGDEYTNVYGNTGPTSFQDQQYIRDLEAKVASDPNYEPWAAELWRMKNLRPNSVKETSMSSAEKKSTGPKFPGYWRGTDSASAARSKMVGSVEESIQHRATVLMNRYKNFKAGK